MRAYQDLQPAILWQLFAELAEIPRPSYSEEQARAWVEAIAAREGWDHESDSAGNIVVRVPATKGNESGPIVVLQAHLDMVTIKSDDSTHDFDKDPIALRVGSRGGEEIVEAHKTTLGADNGIGVIAALAAALDSSVEHGPLELLFTTNEESGMTGARGLNGSMLKGRLLLNLDSEEDDAIYLGCVGRAECFTSWVMNVEPVRLSHDQEIEVSVRGLPGGHSGLEIHQDRTNAIQFLAGLLAEVPSRDWQLVRFAGGSRHNAIPSDAAATLRCTSDVVAEVERALADRSATTGLEPDAVLSVRTRPAETQLAVENERAREILAAIAALPHGVLGRADHDPDIIETSNNAAIAAWADRESSATIEVESSLRSTSEAVLEGLLRQFDDLARSSSGASRGKVMYPPWSPNPESALLATACEVYEKAFGAPPRQAVIHGGLECALIGDKLPGVDMVSFGPRIEEPHTPRERVYTASVEKFWSLLVGILHRLSLPLT